MDRNYIVELIKANRLQEAIKALDEASAGGYLHKDVISLASSYAQYERLNRNATEDFQTVDMQRAKITNTLLSILDELSPEQLEKVVTPTKSKFVAPPTASPDNNKMILYGVIGVLALGLLYFIFGSGGSTDATKPNGSSDLVTPPVNTTVTTSKPITTVTTVSSEKLSGDHSNEDNNGATLLKQNQELKKGVQNYTVDRKYYLIFQQDDGNVAIYKTDNNSFIWGMHNNKNAPLNAKFARMQDDGNFCLYDANNQFLWGTQTTVPGSTLGINQKGELVVLAPSGKEIWNGSK